MGPVPEDNGNDTTTEINDATHENDSGTINAMISKNTRMRLTDPAKQFRKNLYQWTGDVWSFPYRPYINPFGDEAPHSVAQPVENAAALDEDEISSEEDSDSAEADQSSETDPTNSDEEFDSAEDLFEGAPAQQPSLGPSARQSPQSGASDSDAVDVFASPEAAHARPSTSAVRRNPSVPRTDTQTVHKRTAEEG
jgi:hypothetical protein